jgi:hypothetical protein
VRGEQPDFDRILAPRCEDTSCEEDRSVHSSFGSRQLTNIDGINTNPDAL